MSEFLEKWTTPICRREGMSKPSSSSKPTSSSSRQHKHDGRSGAHNRTPRHGDTATISLTEHHNALKSSKAKERGSFICRMKFRNELPEIPFEPKFLPYPFDPSRLTRYQSTDLEKVLDLFPDISLLGRAHCIS